MPFDCGQLTARARNGSLQPLRLCLHGGHLVDVGLIPVALCCGLPLGDLSEVHDPLELEPLAHLEAMFAAGETIMSYESSRVFEWERNHHADLIDSRTLKMLVNGDRTGVEEYGEAKRAVSAAVEAHDRWLADNRIDALVTPAAPGEAPSIATTGDSVFNRVWTLLGVPAVHLPTGKGPSGLPVGIQLTGSRWRDLELLQAARFAESAFGGPQR